MIKNVFVLNINDYRPDLCEYTMPTLKTYAEKIGADFRLITERKFPGWPITYEKLQVHELGEGADWNILIDADFLLHPDLPDFTTMLNPSVVGIHYGFKISSMFKTNRYFKRARHDTAIAGGFVITSDLTHELWEPLDISWEEARKETRREFIIDEYTMTRNLCKYGFPFTGVQFSDTVAKQMIHIGNEERSVEDKAKDVDFARDTLKAWGLL